MNTLAIETSGSSCSIALFDDDEIVAAREEIVGRGHAERLIPWIAALPGGGRADLVLVGCGPGSFTGVRVGIAAARGLALGWGGNIAGVASLALIAANFADHDVTVAVTGGHGELFVQDFAKGLATTALASLTPDVAAARHANALVIGSGAEALIAARKYGDARTAEPSACDMLSLYRRASTLAATPIYGRGADARPMAIC